LSFPANPVSQINPGDQIMKLSHHQTGFKLRAVAIAVVSLSSYAQPALAQTETIQSMQELWNNYRSGRITKSTPVPADGAVERWGDPKSNRPVQTPTPQRATETQQRADKPTSTPRRTTEIPADTPVAEPAVVKAAPKPRQNIEDRYYAQRFENPSSAAVQPGGCANVSRSWEGAAALAERGDERRAYSAYLRLLSTCNDEKELIGTAYQAQKYLSPDNLDRLMLEPVMESPKLRQAMTTLKVQRMYAANKARDSKQALAISREIRPAILEAGDAGALEVSGWLEQRAGQSKTAESLFRSSLKINRDSEGARQGLVFSLLAQNKIDAATREAERLEGASGDEIRAEVLLAQSRSALKGGQYQDALRKLDQAERMGLDADQSVLETRAWILKGLGKNEQSAKLFLSLSQEYPESSAIRVGLIDTLYAARDDKTLAQLSQQTDATGNAAKEAMARRYEEQGRRGEAAKLRGERVEGESGNLSTALGFRWKSGDAGEGRLNETAFPTLAGEFKLGETMRLGLRGERYNLDDGVHSGSGTEFRARLTTQIKSVDVMVGLGASETGDSTKATFETRAKMFTRDGHLEVGVMREPIRDSFRSYSGVITPLTQSDGSTRSVLVGRAMDTFGYIAGSNLINEANRYKLNWSVGGGGVQGTNIENNGYYRAFFAVTKDLDDVDFSWLSVGPYLAVQSYQRDENRFNGPYGGYFSPKSDVGVGMMTNLMTREGSNSLYKLRAQMGYVSRGLYYGNDSGISIEGVGEAAWLISPNVILGAALALRTSPGYNEVIARVGVKVPFESRSKLESSDLTAFRTY